MSPIVVTVTSFVVCFAGRAVGALDFVGARSGALAFCACAARCLVTSFGAFSVAGLLTLLATTPLRFFGVVFLVALAFCGAECLTGAFFAGFFATVVLFSAGFALRFAATGFTAFGRLVVLFAGMADSFDCTTQRDTGRGYYHPRAGRPLRIVHLDAIDGARCHIDAWGWPSGTLAAAPKQLTLATNSHSIPIRIKALRCSTLVARHETLLPSSCNTVA